MRAVPDDPYLAARAGASGIRERLGEHRAALVLGSGWADVVATLGETRASVPMPELPGFPAPSVQGHTGMAHSVDVGGVPVLVLAGRAHLYEGHPVATVVHGVRSAVLAGCRAVLLTNAAGSLVPANGPGTPVLISDHLNLTGVSPMTGSDPPADLPGPLRGPHRPLQRAPAGRGGGRARRASPRASTPACWAGATRRPPRSGCCARMGADLVGMFTVLEAIAARHLGAEVFGVSLVTNLAAGLSAEALDHREVLATGKASVDRLVDLLRAVAAAA